MKPLQASILAMATILATASCDKCDLPWVDCEVVNVDEVYWAAYRSPETFDSALATLEMHGRSAECLERLANDRFGRELQKLRECGQLVTGSPLWNACHEEAERLGYEGNLFHDLMRAIERTAPFASSPTGAGLILAKQIAGASTWQALTDQARSIAPPYEWEFHENKW